MKCVRRSSSRRSFADPQIALHGAQDNSFQYIASSRSDLRLMLQNFHFGSWFGWPLTFTWLTHAHLILHLSITFVISLCYHIAWFAIGVSWLPFSSLSAGSIETFIVLRAKTLARLMVSLHDLSPCNPVTFFRLPSCCVLLAPRAIPLQDLPPHTTPLPATLQR